MTSPTASDDSYPATSAEDPGPGLESRWVAQEPSHPHHPHLDPRQARSVGGLIAVGLVIGYEIGATTLNNALEEDVLPTLQSLIQNTSLRSLELRSAKVLGQVGMWAGLISMAVVVEVGLRRRLARRSRR